MQQQTTFSHVDGPPRDSGVTWSTFSSRAGRDWPQYWQR
jgi:hypothetical protein